MGGFNKTSLAENFSAHGSMCPQACGLRRVPGFVSIGHSRSARGGKEPEVRLQGSFNFFRNEKVGVIRSGFCHWNKLKNNLQKFCEKTCQSN